VETAPGTITVGAASLGEMPSSEPGSLVRLHFELLRPIDPQQAVFINEGTLVDDIARCSAAKRSHALK